MEKDEYLESFNTLINSPRSIPNEFAAEVLERRNTKRLLSTGISFIDDAMCGISKNELMIISGKTGAGKTELLTRVACNIAETGAKVLFISLEDAEFSIVRRIAWPIYLSRWWGNTRFQTVRPRFVEWVNGVDGPASELQFFENEVGEIIKKRFPTLDVFYRNSDDYTINDFEKQISALASNYDVIVLDHIHFFDFLSNENELSGQKRVTKKIASLSKALGIPVIAGAHLRKSNIFNAPTMPNAEDIHGSSDIAKIATSIVIVARASQSVAQLPSKAKTLARTFLKIAKLRTDMSVSIPTALMDFDIETRQYLPNYLLGEFDSEDRWQQWGAERLPDWAKKERSK